MTNIEQDTQWLLTEKYSGEPSAAFLADLKRLKAGNPLAYVIGHAPFLGATIHLDSHPLIPRVETEYWVEQAISEIEAASPKPQRLLDLCAGSGCIGIALLHAFKDSCVDFSEIDVTHHPTIQKNLEVNQIDPSRVTIFGGHLFQNVTTTYDYIFANPPYVDPILDRTTASVKAHEPDLALYGGQSGLELITEIITTASAHLTPTGTLYLEHEPEQSAAIQALGTENDFVVATSKDQYNVERYTRLTRRNG